MGQWVNMNRHQRRKAKSKKGGQYRGLRKLSNDSTFGSKVGNSSGKKKK